MVLKNRAFSFLLLVGLIGVIEAIGLEGLGATPKKVTLSWDYFIQAPRWMYGEPFQVSKNMRGVVRQLYVVKKYVYKEQYEKCIQKINRTTVPQSLRPWLAYQKMDCALKLEKNALPHLLKTKKLIDQNTFWMIEGPYKDLVSKVYYEGLYQIFIQSAQKTMSVSWRYYNQLLSNFDKYSSNQKAQIYKSASELAFVRQNFELAVKNILLSLNYEDNEQLEKKLSSLKRYMSQKEIEKWENKISKKAINIESELFTDEDEKKALDQMKRGLQSGDLVGAIEDGVYLLRKFPGSLTSQWAEKRIKEIYYKLSRKSETQFLLVRLKARNLMKKCDGHRIYKWARYLFYKGLYEDSLDLAIGAYDKLKHEAALKKVLFLMGQSAFYIQKYDHALKYFNELIRYHSGSGEYYDALYYSGLIEFKIKNYVKAQGAFEKLLAFPLEQLEEDEKKVSSLYFLWQSLERLGSKESAQKIKSRLINEYPLTYYGLRANSTELKNESSIKDKSYKFSFLPSFFEKSKLPSQIHIWMTDKEYESWEKFVILSQAGWLREAQKELEALPEPDSILTKLFYAKLWGVVLDYDKSIRLINEVWEEDKSYIQLEVLKYAYPKEYQNYIQKYAKKYNLDPLLVLSLIRQESGFRPRAVSSAGAKGLMQLMPMTAKEVAIDVRSKGDVDLEEPQTNIFFGSYYMKKVLKMTKGHIPFMLAAYNVGIGNIKRWMSPHEDYKSKFLDHSSKVEDEIWVEELPWDETRFYVKAILRNYIINKILNADEKSITLPDPIWKYEEN